MQFDSSRYGPEVARLLALAGDGLRAMPLAEPLCISEAARDAVKNTSARTLLPHARAPEAALAGLYLYFGCWDEAHRTAQDIPTAEGSYWHAIVHRQEPDAGNSGYWFRRLGQHPIFPRLWEEARRLEQELRPDRMLIAPGRWDPFRFIDYCEEARHRPGSSQEEFARQLQLLEWQLLFDFCAGENK